MALIDDVKKTLGVSGDEHNTEIQDLIDAAKIELEESGVSEIDDTDKLTKIAIIFYCKAYSRFIWDLSEAEYFEKQYSKLKSKMSRSTTYGGDDSES